jgi:hypothetical protein
LLSRRNQFVSVELKALPAFFQFLIRACNLKLNVDPALLVFRPALSDSEHCLLNSRVQAPLVKWHIHIDADLPTQIALRVGRLPESIVAPKDFHIWIVVFAGKRDCRLFRLDFGKERS